MSFAFSASEEVAAIPKSFCHLHVRERSIRLERSTNRLFLELLQQMRAILGHQGMESWVPQHVERLFVFLVCVESYILAS